MIVPAGLALALSLSAYSHAQEQLVPVRGSEAVSAKAPALSVPNRGANSSRPNATPAPAPKFGTAPPAPQANVVPHRRHREIPSESWCATVPAAPVASETAKPLSESLARVQENPDELVQTATPIEEDPQELVQGEPVLGLN